MVHLVPVPVKLLIDASSHHQYLSRGDRVCISSQSQQSPSLMPTAPLIDKGRWLLELNTELKWGCRVSSSSVKYPSFLGGLLVFNLRKWYIQWQIQINLFRDNTPQYLQSLYPFHFQETIFWSEILRCNRKEQYIAVHERKQGYANPTQHLQQTALEIC